MAPYCILEIFAYKYENNMAISVLSFIEPFIHSRKYTELETLNVRGFSFEPSYLSLYVASVLPWIFGNTIKKNNKIKSLIILILFLLIIILSGSRTMYLVFLIELIVFGAIMFNISNSKKFKKMIVLFVPLILLVSLFWENIITVFVSLASLESTDISNITRFSSIHAALRLFIDNPVVGVGYGLAGAYLPDYYPDYAFLSYEIKDWAYARDLNLGTPVFALMPRLAAETGLIGLSLILYFWVVLIKKLYNTIKLFKNEKIIAEFGVKLLVSLIGLLVASFGVDAFTFIGYWLLFGISVGYIENKNADYEKKDIINYIAS